MAIGKLITVTNKATLLAKEIFALTIKESIHKNHANTSPVTPATTTILFSIMPITSKIKLTNNSRKGAV